MAKKNIYDHGWMITEQMTTNNFDTNFWFTKGTLFIPNLPINGT